MGRWYLKAHAGDLEQQIFGVESVEPRIGIGSERAEPCAGGDFHTDPYHSLLMSTAPDKSLENWIWDAACSIRGAKDAGKYKDYILPLIFTKRLCDVLDDELNRIAKEVGGRAKAFKFVRHDKKLVRFYLPLEPKTPADPVWSVIRTLSDTLCVLFRTLLHQLMTAQLRVHDLDLPETGTDTTLAGQIRTFPNQGPTHRKGAAV